MSDREQLTTLAERIQQIIEDLHDVVSPPDDDDPDQRDKFFAAVGYLDQAQELLLKLAIDD